MGFTVKFPSRLNWFVLLFPLRVAVTFRALLTKTNKDIAAIGVIMVSSICVQGSLAVNSVT